MKFKFNFKLTIFLVGLFIGLLLIVLGSKSEYCLSFGFIILGLSMPFYAQYNTEKTTKSLEEISTTLEEVDGCEELSPEDEAYISKELYNTQKKLIKKKKQVIIMFYCFALLMFVLGVWGLF